MSNGNKYILTIKKTVMQRKGSEVISVLQNGSKVTGEVFIDNDPVMNRLTVYLDTKNKEDAIGMVEAITNEDGSLAFPAEEIRPMLKIGYTAEIIGLGSNTNTFMISFTEIVPNVKKRQNKSEDYETEITRVVNAGYCTETEVRERISVMEDLFIPKEMIVDILKRYRNYKRPAKRPSTIFIDPYGENMAIMRQAFINVLTGRAQIFEGPKSVGKNVAVETIAWLLNMPMYLITFNRYMSGDDIYGTKTTVSPEIASYSSEELESMATYELLAKSGEKLSNNQLQEAARFMALSAKASAVSIKQEDSQLVDALSDGGVMCFNEMNLAEANFFASFANQITDGTGFLFVPGIGRIDINPDFVLVGTQNGGYLGTNEQNAATMSRFACLQFDFPGSIKSQLEAAVGKKTLNTQYFLQCDELYKGFLTAVKSGYVRDDCLNIRGIVAALKAKAAYPEYTTLSQQIRTQVINTCADSGRGNLIAQLEDKINL